MLESCYDYFKFFQNLTSSKIILAPDFNILVDFYFSDSFSYLFWLARGGTAGGRFKISYGLPVGAVVNCADNTGKTFIGIVFENFGNGED